MKIVANIRDGYMIEATADELANLMGFSTDRERTTHAYQNNKRQDLRITDEIPVHAMYTRLFRMANMERELTEISAKLKAASDFVNTALPTIKHVNKTEEVA